MPAITDSEFGRFQRFIYDAAGISLPDSKKALVSGRLAKRLAACHVATYAEYFRLLTNGDAPLEVQMAVDLLTTNETYFFRESYQLDAFRDEILPELYQHKPRGRRLSVWSAGCSSGEEAYTIAILIMETGLFSE